MSETININWEEHRRHKYIDPQKYGRNDVIACVNERERFSEVRELINKINDINYYDFVNMFTQRFIICSCSENDACLAMLAIYYTIQDKMEGESGSRYIIEKDVVPISFGMGGFNDMDSSSDNDDDELSERLKFSENARCMHVYSTFSFAGMLDELERSDSALFILSVGVPNDISDIEYDDPDDKDVNSAAIGRLGAEYGYIRVNIKRDSAEELNMMMRKRLEDYGFDISGIENELKLYCEKAYRPDEYHLNSMTHGLLNMWLLSGKKERVLVKEDILSILNGMNTKEKVKAGGQTTAKLVGLKKERKKIDGIAKMLTFEQKRIKMGISGGFNGCNMVFAGPPGTAKTTLAREFAKMLAENNVISGSDNFKECRKSDLVGKYVGWTASMIDNMFESMDRAGGGVIFFDEIYTLTEKEQTCFDTEAVTCIVQNMENYRSKVFCIFAGYGDKMETFLSSNPGIRSRIHFIVNFSNYDTETLIDITKSVCSSCGYDFPKGGESILSEYFDRLREIRGPQFGNGREARNIISNASQKMAMRLWNVKKPTEKRLRALSTSDLKLAAEDILSSEVYITDNSGKRKIGF